MHILIQVWEISKLWLLNTLTKHTEYLLTFHIDYPIRIIVAPHCPQLRRWYNNAFIEKCPDILFEEILELDRSARIEFLSGVFEDSVTVDQDIIDLVNLQERYLKANEILQWFEENKSKIDTGNDEDEETLDESYRRTNELEDISSFYRFKRLNYAEILPAVHRVKNLVEAVKTKINSILGPDEEDNDDDDLLFEE